MPDYKLQVWFWRTRDMLISQESELKTDKQKITCSTSLPLTVAQFSHTSSQLLVWEVLGTQKFCKLIRRKIQLDFAKTDGPFHAVYSIEGNLHIANRHGDIYNIIPSSGSINLIAKWNGAEDGHSVSTIAYVRNGILVAGPDGTLKYYKRQKYVWNEIFQSPAPDTFITLKSFNDNESVIGTTVNGAVYKLHLSDSDKISITKIKVYEKSYENFTMVNPMGKHLVAVDSLNEILVMSVVDGVKLAKVDIKSQTTVEANPCYPFIAVGNQRGDVTVVSLFDPESPKTLAEFMLTRRPIKKVQFSNEGNYLFVIDTDLNFFIIKTSLGEKMTILHHFKENFKFLEFFFVEGYNKLDFLFLCSELEGCTSGNSIIKITIELDELEDAQRTQWSLPGNYNSIMAMTSSPETFYAIRSGVKYVEVLTISGETITLTDVVESPHQLRHIESFNDGNHLVTWSIDGIAAAYDVKNDHKLLVAFIASNRHNYGIKMARCDAKCELMVTLDQRGNLICSKFDTSKNEDKFSESMELLEADIAEKFALPTSGGFPGLSEEYFGKKFTDLKSELTYEMEARESEQTRKLLFAKLSKLQKSVKQLLDENEKHADDEKLEVQDFNLDLVTTAEKEKAATSERDQEEKKMMDFIDAQTAMNDWIVDRCWSPMEVKGAKLRGMFINMFVENYALLPENHKDQLRKIQLFRAIENSVAREDAFLPWRPIATM